MPECLRVQRLQTITPRPFRSRPPAARTTPRGGALFVCLRRFVCLPPMVPVVPSEQKARQLRAGRPIPEKRQNRRANVRQCHHTVRAQCCTHARTRACAHARTCALTHARSIVFNRHAHPCDAVCCHSRWACGCSVVVLQVESEQALGPNTQLLCKSLVASVRVGVPVAARLLLVSWLLAALLTGELHGPRAGADLRLAGGMYAGCPAWAATSY